MELPKQLDNVNNRVVDDLKERLTDKSKVAIAAASFSIYAFEALKDELEKVDELRFIFTSPTFVKEKNKKEKREFYIPRLNRERNLYGSDFEIKLRNQLSQKAIAKECADWIRRKVRFKSNVSNSAMGGFMYVKEADGQGHTYLPFNDFTTTELGCERGDSIYTMVNVFPSPMAETYLQIFNQQWRYDEHFSDVTQRVLDYVDTVYNENAPEYIYFITLYNIFNEFLEDISEDVLPNERTGFKNSVIWNKLYNFQRDAALAIINKLEKYNGCILADSVGLGKTFTALAVIKYYENRNKSVLVLCPKKLNDNWMTFRTNYKNNPIAADRLRYDILFHTDLTRDHGESNGIDLSRVNWGNYDLVVIDESHNFRNGGDIDEGFEDDDDDDHKENRYVRLMNRVIRAGVQTKVLMLSATPVNNRFNDLKNQLQLAYEGHSDRIDELLDTHSSIDDIFRQAQAAYNAWAKLPPEQRTTDQLLKNLSFDFFTVLDAVTIARSRQHIVKYYDTKDIGNFPHRLPPISRRPPLTDLSNAITFKEIAGMLNSLNLSIYTPSLYIYDSMKDHYEIKMEGSGISIDGREKGMRKLMAINLLKRLESSVNSFRLTLERIKELIEDTIKAINNYEENGTEEALMVADPLETEDDGSDADPFVGRNNKIDLRDMDYVKWRYDLKRDLAVFNEMLTQLDPITPAHDSKLQLLVEDLKQKFQQPINTDNRKVLIFTAFADTADYLYEQLSTRIKKETGLNVALITGSTEGKCTIPKFPVSFNNILTFFSPKSKDRDAIFPNAKEDIDVLIATDCISEGQNLQDCDYLINYDIHWNPVRIIQRFGRIDRIGSKNSQIQLVNYWPDMELDEYIKLKGRVESRMKATVLTSTGDDNPLSVNERGDLEYRRNQLKRLQEQVVDIEDMDTGINIMDLGLNEFRMDLLSYIKDNPDVEHAPYGMEAVVEHTDLAKPGVIFILKNRNNAVNIDHKNLLHPFYMVYLSDDGEVICDHLQPKALLDTMRHLCKGKTKPDMDLCRALNRETKDGRDMRKYNELLQEAINSIISVKQESDIDSLFSPGESTALKGDVKGLDDFELITFLIIR
jgi:SNF2 family DNA or RNA helicase